MCRVWAGDRPGSTLEESKDWGMDPNDPKSARTHYDGAPELRVNISG